MANNTDLLDGLCGYQYEDEALDMLYATVDNYAHALNFGAIDDLILRADVDRLGLQLSLGILTITLPCVDDLKNRDAFYTKVEAFVNRTQPERAHGLLVGLSGKAR